MLTVTVALTVGYGANHQTQHMKGAKQLKKKYDSDFAFRYHRKSIRLKTHNYVMVWDLFCDNLC